MPAHQTIFNSVCLPVSWLCTLFSMIFTVWIYVQVCLGKYVNYWTWNFSADTCIFQFAYIMWLCDPIAFLFGLWRYQTSEKGMCHTNSHIWPAWRARALAGLQHTQSGWVCLWLMLLLDEHFSFQLLYHPAVITDPFKFCTSTLHRAISFTIHLPCSMDWS